MRLRHIHLPSAPPSFPSYALAASVQELLRRRLLDAKDRLHGSPAPLPTLLSFTPQPTYTLGRRQTRPLSPAEDARLRAPLTVRFSRSEPGTESSYTYTPAVLASPRGGLTTYHGPGQLVLWPVADLRAADLSVRCYARLLEHTTARVLHRLFGLDASTTDDPGVWVRHRSGRQHDDDGLRKIAAMGVHLRRHVSALGVAINLDMPAAGREAKEEEASNPWARIVACGLEGKGVTSVAAETASLSSSPQDVAAAWAKELAPGIGADGVETVAGDEVTRLVEAAAAASDPARAAQEGSSFLY